MDGNELKTRRNNLDLTQQELAEQFGVDRNTINRWENGILKVIPKWVHLALLGLVVLERDRKVDTAINGTKQADERTISEMLDEAKEKTRQKIEQQFAENNREFPSIYNDLDEFINRSLHRPLMTRMVEIDYDRENNKRRRKRLINLEGVGWLADEDLAALNPDEQVLDFDKNEIVRLGDLQIYKSAKRKAGLNGKKPR